MPISAEDYEATVNGTTEEVNLEEPTFDPQIQPQNPTPQAEVPAPAADPNTTVPATPAPTNTFNLDEELVKTTGGAIKSKDELSALLDNARKATELETQLRTYQEENTSLKAKSEISPYANDFTKKLDGLYRGGANESQIQAFITINKVQDIDALTPLQASALALQVKHGLTPDEAEAYLNNKYDIDPEKPGIIPDRNAEIALKIDSGADRDFLKSHKAEVSQTPVNNQEREQQAYREQQTAKIHQLQPIAQTALNSVLTTSFKEVSINGKEGDAAVKVDLPLSEESKAGLSKTVADMVANNWNGLAPDEKGVEAIKTFSDNVLVLQNYKSWLIDVASKTEMRVRAEYNNPSPINRGPDAPAPGKTSKEEMEQGIMETLGL